MIIYDLPAMKKVFHLSIFLFLALLAFPSHFSAQEVEDDSPIKVDTLLYSIPFTVTDSAGKHIPALTKENFLIFQDGDLQQIEFFLDDQAPTNVAILIDTSISTKPVLKNIQKAARDFIKVLRPEDKGLIVSFDYKTSFLSDLTSDQKKLSKAIDNISIAGQSGSGMNEAVYKIVTGYLDKSKGRKAIIVLTDGIITDKSYTDSQVLRILNQSDTLLYPVIFKTSSYYIRDSNQPNARLSTPYENLRILADLSAGRLYEKDSESLKEAFQDIAIELKKQYIVGYYPVETGKPRKIRIKVTDRPDAIIKAKKSLNL